jgi:hypothetical protein
MVTDRSADLFYLIRSVTDADPGVYLSSQRVNKNNTATQLTYKRHMYACTSCTKS